MKYVIKKKNKTYKIKSIEYPFKGYKFKANSELVNNIIVMDNKLINNVVISKINLMFTRLLMIVNDAFDSDDNPNGTAIALDEIAMVRSSILNKYAKYLEKEKQELYLKKLELVEEEMKYKFFIMQNSYVEVEEKGKGR